MNDQPKDPRIRDALERIIPHRNAPEGLLAGARRRRSQRRAMMGGAAAVLAVAMMVPIAMHLSQDNITANPATTETPVPEEIVRLTNPCLEDERPESDGSPTTGAQRVWWCGDYLPGEDDYSWGTIGPLEPLVNDSDKLLTAWEGFEPLPADAACTAEYMLAYTLVFEYADGTSRNLHGELHGCRTTRDGQEVGESDVRLGGEELFDLAKHLWQEQRDDYPELENPYVPCTAARSIMGAEVEDVNRGAICYVDDNGQFGDISELSPELVAQIRDAISAEAHEIEPGDALVTQHRQILELVTQFADPLQFHTEDGTVYEWWTETGMMQWEPSSQLQEALARHLDGAPSGPGSLPDPTNTNPAPLPDPIETPAPPQPWVPEACHITGDGIITSTVPVEGTPEEIWLCPAPVAGMELQVMPPAEPLRVGVAEAMTALRALQPMDPEQPCHDDLGPAFHVVHNYADGSQHIVEFQNFGCGAVIAGDDLLGGGSGYFEILQQLWQDQRAQQREVIDRPGPLCPQLFSSMPVGSSDEFVSGSICNVARGVEEFPLPPELIVAFDAALKDASPPADYDFEPLLQQVVLLNEHGDPYTLQRTTNGWLTQEWEGEPVMVALAPELEEHLDALIAN